MRASAASLFAAVLLAALGGCAAPARLPVEAGMGANPQLPQPSPSLIPAVDIAPRIGWTEGAAPEAAPGFRVNAFATGLDHPRWLLVLPNGDVLVAETRSASTGSRTAASCGSRSTNATSSAATCRPTT